MSRGRKGDSSGGGNKTVKEERAAQRATRTEESVRRRKRAALRGKLINVGVVVLIVAGIVAFFLPKRGSYSAGGSGASVPGVQFYQNPTGHTLSAVAYPQTPPVGGEHHPTWLNCGIYSEPVPNNYAVHSLEHGAVWVTYNPSISAEALETLRSYMPSSYVILSPYVGLTVPVALSSWNTQLYLDGPDDPRLPQFFEEYWRNQNVPEPGALCTGGMDGPGRVS